MDSETLDRLSDLAETLVVDLRPLVADGGAADAPTLIASAARMSGTLLLRGFTTGTPMPVAGTDVTSPAVDAFVPTLVHLILETVASLGRPVDAESVDATTRALHASRLTLAETQARLDPLVLGLCEARALSFQEGAVALAIATGLIVFDAADALDPAQGARVAVDALAEGSTTAPIAIGATEAIVATAAVAPAPAPTSSPRKPWYRPW